MRKASIKINQSLQSLNSFGIAANSHYLCQIQSSAQLQALLQDQQWQSAEKFILGGGSNILLTQDVSGLVIHNQITGIERIKETEDHVWLKVGAGQNWHQFVLYTLEKNYQGLENLSLIPGSVGAAPLQNIGAYGVELKDVFDSLEAIKRMDGSAHVFNHQQCDFGYRHSIFKATLKDQFVITHVTLRLNKKPQLNVEYAPLKKIFNEMNVEPSMKSISHAVIKIRQSKLPDPNKLGNAGSFFKNPVIDVGQFSALLKAYPDIPHYETEVVDKIKIPAGWLIEQCGFKGKRFGDAGVHDKQALVLVNYGHATGAEIKQLAENIQTTVHDRFGISLQAEVNII